MQEDSAALTTIVRQFVGNVLFTHYSVIAPHVLSTFNEKWIKLLSKTNPYESKTPYTEWLDSLDLEFREKGLGDKWDEMERRIWNVLDAVLPQAEKKRFRVGRDG